MMMTQENSTLPSSLLTHAVPLTLGSTVSMLLMNSQTFFAGLWLERQLNLNPKVRGPSFRSGILRIRSQRQNGDAKEGEQQLNRAELLRGTQGLCKEYTTDTSSV